MGAKTLHNEDNGGHGSPMPNQPESSGGEPRGCHLSRDGDGCLGASGTTDDGNGEDNGDDDDEHEVVDAAASLNSTISVSEKTTKKKARKRPKRKGKAGGMKQSSPPRIPLHDLFKSDVYPTGEFLDYGARSGATGEGRASSDGNRLLEDKAFLNDYRKAAEVHRQVRRWVQDTVRPGQTLMEIANGIDDGVRALLDNDGLESGQGLKSGLGFPTGLALNNCVAHYTPNPGQKDIFLKHEDVMKVDFGVQINGWIVDSAFTMTFDPAYDNLLAAVKDATNTGIKNAGIDVRISDVSAAIQEAMESYEVEIRGKTYPVRPVRNICGHDIKRYRIHGEKTIPFVKNSKQTKMEEGDIFAVETFGTTGRGYTTDGDGVYGYGLNYDAPTRVNLPLSSANRVFKTIRDNFGTLVFCRRYLERLGCERYLVGINSLISNGIIESYPPLMDIPGSYSAQFEHTILLRESVKEVLSRGNDY